MLIICPECTQKVSDRAPTCPHCGFPIGEHLAERAKETAIARDRETRAAVGEVDCVACEASGFATIEEQDPDGNTRSRFNWCDVCEHTGRVTLCRSERGYFAVARLHVEAFAAGTRDDGDALVVFLGVSAPGPHRFPQAGRRHVREPK